MVFIAFSILGREKNTKTLGLEVTERNPPKFISNTFIPTFPR
jgi:hypothetical protein